MADGNRAIQLSLGAPLVKPEDDWYVPLLRAHVDWLMDDKNIVRKNHALHQHAGLVVAAAVLKDRRALGKARDRMVRQFESTFDSQGANDEGSVGYHEMNLKWWAQAWLRIEAEGLEVPVLVAERLNKGRTTLAQLVMPNGRLPQIGDTKRTPVSRGLGPHVDFVATHGKEGVAPLETAVAYERGYVVSRSGWGDSRPAAEETHILLRHGVDVQAHSHQDRGSMHLYSRGRPWLVDSGFYSYQTGDFTRNHFLSREAHNIASLPDLIHDDKAPVDLERFTANADLHDSMLLDRGYAGVQLRRRVLYLPGPDCCIVWDESSRPMPIRQSWHVDLGVSATRHDRGFELRSLDRTLTMVWLGQVPSLSRQIAEKGDLSGWIATKWKTLEPATLLTAESGRNRSRNIVIIAPSTPREFSVVRSYVTVGGLLTATLMRGPNVWMLQVDGENVSIEPLERNWADS